MRFAIYNGKYALSGDHFLAIGKQRFSHFAEAKDEETLAKDQELACSQVRVKFLVENCSLFEIVPLYFNCDLEIVQLSNGQIQVKLPFGVYLRQDESVYGYNFIVIPEGLE